MSFETKLAEATSKALIAMTKLNSDGQIDKDVLNAIVASSELVGEATSYYRNESRFDRYFQLILHGLILRQPAEFDINALVSFAVEFANKAMVAADKYMEEISSDES